MTDRTSAPGVESSTALAADCVAAGSSRFARETFASGAAVTKRLRALEERGLVSRRPDDRDRRVSHLALTEQGRALTDRLLPRQLRYDSDLLAAMGADRRRELGDLLGELLLLLEGRLGARQL
ncbi:MarR family transcriptional regulator [Microbispora siamensis]